jgi:hypothetical protein
MDYHVVYLKNKLALIVKTQFKPWIWPLLHLSLTNKIKLPNIQILTYFELKNKLQLQILNCNLASITWGNENC